MTVHDTRHAVEPATLPRPREPLPDDALLTTDAPVAPAPADGQFPWPEPWRYSRAERPRSEFWDVASASWRSAGPYPRPR